MAGGWAGVGDIDTAAMCMPSQYAMVGVVAGRLVSSRVERFDVWSGTELLCGFGGNVHGGGGERGRVPDLTGLG